MENQIEPNVIYYRQQNELIRRAFVVYPSVLVTFNSTLDELYASEFFDGFPNIWTNGTEWLVPAAETEAIKLLREDFDVDINIEPRGDKFATQAIKAGLDPELVYLGHCQEKQRKALQTESMLVFAKKAPELAKTTWSN